MRLAIWGSFLLLLSVTVNAWDKESVCLSPDPLYSILQTSHDRGLLDDFRGLYRYSDGVEFPEASQVQDRLKRYRADYLEAIEAEKDLVRIILLLKDLNIAEVNLSLNAYFEKLQTGIEEIQYETAESLESDKFEVRSARLKKLKEDLISRYTKELEISLGKITISEEDRVHFLKWIFILVPDGPIYQGGWSEEASILSDFSWDVFYGQGKLSSTGRLSRGVYMFSTNFNSDYPGLVLNIALRDKANPNYDLTIEVAFSPFVKADDFGAEQIKLCDYSSSPNFCVPIPLNEWCQSN